MFVRGPRVSPVCTRRSADFCTHVRKARVDSSRFAFAGARFTDHRHDFAATSRRANSFFRAIN